jgi:DNA-binding MarR family transcriptional regulator
VSSDDLRPATTLDETFHARARLGIMTVLVTAGDTDFRNLKHELGLTDGNLGAHLRVLEEAGYVNVKKTFADRKPRTIARATPSGRLAFEAYLEHLEDLIAAARTDTRRKRR